MGINKTKNIDDTIKPLAVLKLKLFQKLCSDASINGSMAKTVVNVVAKIGLSLVKLIFTTLSNPLL